MCCSPTCKCRAPSTASRWRPWRGSSTRTLVVILTSGKWTSGDTDVPEGAVFVAKPYSTGAVAQLVKALVKPH